MASTFSSTNGISFSGLASGLNTSQLISSLVAFESQSIKQPLLNKKSLLQNKLTTLDSLNTKLSSLQSKVKALAVTSDFLANTVSSSVSTLATATADGSALEGSHTIYVKQLAQAESETNGTALGDVDTTTAGTGTLSITYAGTQHDITITDGTLNGLTAAINGAGIGVKASVVNVNTPENPQYKLILQGSETGSTKTIVVDATGLSNNAGDAVLGAFSDLVGAANSKFTVDGIVDIERLNNSINDVLPGVTINLVKADELVPVTLTVSKNTDAVMSKIQGFIDAYNDAAAFMKTQNNYTAGTTVNPLFGDLALNMATSKLSSFIFSVQNSADPKFSSLSQIGITTKIDGSLTLDSAKLKDAIDDSPQAVAKLFATGLEGGGVAAQMKDWLDDYLSTASEGLIQSEKDSINASIKSLDDSILKADARLGKYQDGLTQRYTALESLMSKLQAQQSFLSAIQF